LEQQASEVLLVSGGLLVGAVACKTQGMGEGERWLVLGGAVGE
jgi:hypothetical protein